MFAHWKGLKKPLKLEKDEKASTDTYGVFWAEPFESGYGITIGNALRRVLISSLKGAAITAVRIESVLHEFSPIPYVLEDATDLILNLKGVVIKLHSNRPKTIRFSSDKEGIVTAGQFETDADVEILNKDHYIATIEKGGKLEMEMTVGIGRGYVPAEKHNFKNLPLGFIPIDSIFSPIRKVNFTVENTRVGQRTDYDRLNLFITTNGSITPDEAVLFAAKILRDHFDIFLNPRTIQQAEEEEKAALVESSFIFDQAFADTFSKTSYSATEKKGYEFDKDSLFMDEMEEEEEEQYGLDEDMEGTYIEDEMAEYPEEYEGDEFLVEKPRRRRGGVGRRGRKKAEPEDAITETAAEEESPPKPKSRRGRKPKKLLEDTE